MRDVIVEGRQPWTTDGRSWLGHGLKVCEVDDGRARKRVKLRMAELDMATRVILG